MKTRIKALLLALMLSANTIGCSVDKYDKTEPIVNTDDNSDMNHVISFENKELYLALCDEVIPKYNYEEYYITPLEIEKIINSTKNKTTCDNTSFSTVNLIERIIKNTEEYVSQKVGVYNAFDIGNINENIDPVLLKNCIIESIVDNLSNDNSDTDENYCKMTQLKIVVDNNIDADATFLDGIKEDNDEYQLIDNDTISLNINSIVKRYERAVKSYTEYSNIYDDPKDIYSYIKKYILDHELTHTKQYICSCRREKGEENISMQIVFPSDSCSNGEDAIGSLLIESSAESKIYSEKLDESSDLSYTYEDLRDEEALLFLLSLFQHQDVSEYYRAINDTDFQAFYDFFGLDNDLKKSTFYKILYSFEARYFRNDFLIKYDPNITSIKYGEAEDIIGKAAYIDLYKMFTKNYIEYICDNDITSTVEENILLHEVVKSIILSKCYEAVEGDDGYEYLFDEQVVDGFLKLDNIFYTFLSEYNDLSFEEVETIKEQSESAIYSVLMGSKYNEQSISLYEQYPILRNINFSVDPSPSVWKEFEKRASLQNDMKVLSK